MEENQYLKKMKESNFNQYQYFMYGLGIIQRLIEKMYEAYFIGGVVRDYLLNHPFTDIDIATDATPQQIQSIFTNADMRYADVGTVIIKNGDFKIEITTFRKEKYEKSRLPSKVHYSKKLSVDVLRRDYTINALALSTSLQLIDLVDGQRDIKRRRIRIIGNGKQRFTEDPLRILRGINLISRYNFQIEPSTMRAMKKKRDLLFDLTPYKFQDEMYKILSGKYYNNALVTIINLDLFKKSLVYKQWVIGICKKCRNLLTLEKFAALYYLNNGVDDHTPFGHDDLQTIKQIIEVCHILSDQQVDPMIIFKYGSYLTIVADKILSTFHKTYRSKTKFIKKIDRKLPIKDRRDFNFSATELIDLLKGEKGPIINQIMDTLLFKVIKGEIPNNNALIRQEAIKLVAKEKDKNISKESFYEENTMNFKNQLSIEDNNQPIINNLQKEIKQQNIISKNTYSEVPDDELAYFDEYLPNIEETPNYQDVLNSISTNSNQNLDLLRAEYNSDYEKMYEIVIKGVTNFNSLTLPEKIQIQTKVNQTVKDTLLSNNPKYQLLHEKGLI